MTQRLALLILSTFLLFYVLTRPLIRQNFINNTDNVEYIENSDMAVSLKMYYLIIHYSNKYNVPKEYAFSVAYLETRYQGPFHWKYNPYQTSYAGAVGPMQLMPSTANWINKSNHSTNQIKTDLSLNIETSMKYISYLKRKYHKWDLVFGYYNTGRPIINQYAMNVVAKKYKWYNEN